MSGKWERLIRSECEEWGCCEMRVLHGQACDHCSASVSLVSVSQWLAENQVSTTSTTTTSVTSFKSLSVLMWDDDDDDDWWLTECSCFYNRLEARRRLHIKHHHHTIFQKTKLILKVKTPHFSCLHRISQQIVSLCIWFPVVSRHFLLEILIFVCKKSFHTQWRGREVWHKEGQQQQQWSMNVVSCVESCWVAGWINNDHLNNILCLYFRQSLANSWSIHQESSSFSHHKISSKFIYFKTCFKVKRWFWCKISWTYLFTLKARASQSKMCYCCRMPDIRKSMSPNKEFDKNELRERLTPTQYQVTQEHQTER